MIPEITCLSPGQSARIMTTPWKGIEEQLRNGGETSMLDAGYATKRLVYARGHQTQKDYRSAIIGSALASRIFLLTPEPEVSKRAELLHHADQGLNVAISAMAALHVPSIGAERDYTEPLMLYHFRLAQVHDAITRNTPGKIQRATRESIYKDETGNILRLAGFKEEVDFTSDKEKVPGLPKLERAIREASNLSEDSLNYFFGEQLPLLDFRKVRVKSHYKTRRRKKTK